jgi:rubredoxin
LARKIPSGRQLAVQKSVASLKYHFIRIHPETPFIMTTTDVNVHKTYMCLICGYIYDEAAGVPDEGIAPGTRWEDVPMNWTCPECGARKEDFEMVQV